MFISAKAMLDDTEGAPRLQPIDIFLYIGTCLLEADSGLLST